LNGTSEDLYNSLEEQKANDQHLQHVSIIEIEKTKLNNKRDALLLVLPA